MKHLVAPKVRVIRSAVLSGYVDVAKSVGLDPYAMITRCGVPAACLTDPEVKVSAVAVVRLLEESAQRSGKPDFGLRLAERRSLSNIGALALLVREQPTIRRAIGVLIGYMYLHSEALLLSLEEEGQMATLKLAVDVGRPVPVRQGIELGLGFLHRSLQQLLGKNWKPQDIYFTHARPTRTDTYRRFFATPVEFNQEFNGIVCYARDIDAAVPASDPAMARHVQQYLDTIASRPHTTTSAKVRECIYLMLSSGLCSAAQVAKRLGTDRRTIHRHLAKEGETFTSLMDSVRSELVTRYIENRDRPLSETSDLLGFSAQSAFSRWFRGKFGCSISEWRARQLTVSTTTPPRSTEKSLS
jgi:AraC-like DNA-binding protein/DNA-binding transcriptional ArsR family regulator